MVELLTVKPDPILTSVLRGIHRIVQPRVSSGIRNVVAWDIGVHLLKVRRLLKNLNSMVVGLQGSRKYSHLQANFGAKIILSDVRLEFVVEAFIT